MTGEPSATAPMTLGARIRAWVTEFIQFGMVGALAFVIDSGLFNLLQHGPTGVLAGHPNTANVVSATIATTFSWVANRYWTYRDRTRDNAWQLGLTGPLADNVAAYVVGFALGTAFRFTFYHYVVFTGSAQEPRPEADVPHSTPRM